MNITSLITGFSLVLMSYSTKAQPPNIESNQDLNIDKTKAKQRGSLIQIRLGGQVPLGNWYENYGTLLDAGLQYSWMNGNLFYGISSTYLYGGNVRKLDDILGHLITRNGEIMSNDGSSLSGLQSELRGGQIGLHFGSIISKWGKSNSNPIIWLEAGVIQHKRALLSSGGVPQLEPPYIYGLDNLHRGVYFQENLGWLHIGKNAPHFKIEFQTFQSITRLIREYQFILEEIDTTVKWDFGIGFRATWILPILSEKSQTKYYY
jgi:hypothetical protein